MRLDPLSGRKESRGRVSVVHRDFWWNCKHEKLRGCISVVNWNLKSTSLGLFYLCKWSSFNTACLSIIFFLFFITTPKDCPSAFWYICALLQSFCQAFTGCTDLSFWKIRIALSEYLRVSVASSVAGVLCLLLLRAPLTRAAVASCFYCF